METMVLRNDPQTISRNNTFRVKLRVNLLYLIEPCDQVPTTFLCSDHECNQRDDL